VKAKSEMLRRLGARLRALREREGLNQAEAGHQAGLSDRQIGRIEAGTANVTIGSLEALASVYGVTIRVIVVG
jgi:transcriptional regulator with XRE-family HTH domain